MCEVVIEVVMLLASFMFVFGSMCFFSGLPFQVLEVGELLFIVASLIYTSVAVLELYELCQTTKASSVCQDSTFHEQNAYLISATIFTAGTILFWPSIYRGNKVAEEKGEGVAAWCFIIGSMGFVIASFWNALSLSDNADEDEEGGAVWRRVTKVALFFSILGGVLFTTGSYLYTLDQEEGCDPFIPTNLTAGGARSGKWCVGVTDQGTIMYLIGSCFYLIQSILNCIKLCIRKCINKKTGYCEVRMHEDNESDMHSSYCSDNDTDRAVYDAELAAE